MTRRITLLICLTLFVAACGGGSGGVISMPGPTATPAPGGTGTVTGSAVAAATAAQARAPIGPVEPVRRAVARPVYVPNQLMVKFRAGTPTVSASSVHDQAGASMIRVMRHLDVHVVRLAPGASAAAVMAAYRGSALVEYVEQDAYAYASATPNDPLFSTSQAWHYNQVNLPSAWDVTTGSAAIIVAVLDTGIRDDHPDLVGITAGTNSHNFFNGADDANYRDPGCPTVAVSQLSHGTHVAGTVAAMTNNSTGVAGVNWGGAAGTKIMAIRVLGEDIPSVQCGVGFLSDVADGITYAADHGARVINMSLGGTAGSTTMDTAIDYARNTRGVVIFAAAGNNSCGAVEYPARNANVIPVAATGNTSPITPASYSACGAELTARGIAAPGGAGSFGVWSTSWSPSVGFVYAGFTGTSMATPHAAGVAALMLSRGIASPATIQSVLRSTAACPSGFTCPNTQLGAGVINAAAAVGVAPNAGRLCAFAGTLSGSTITRESEMRLVSSSGAFTITNAQSGTRSVFLWQDFDNNGTVTPGDAYGQVNGVGIFSGMTTSGINVTVQTRTAASTVLTVPGGTAPCF
jgi:serine protease